MAVPYVRPQEVAGEPLTAKEPPGDGRWPGLLMTVEQVALLWFGEVGAGGSASSNCQKIRRLIPDTLPARRIGNRWFVNRAIAEAWAAGCDPASVMAHPDTRAVLNGNAVPSPRRADGRRREGSR